MRRVASKKLNVETVHSIPSDAIIAMMLRRRSKTPKRKTLVEKVGPSCDTPQTAQTSKAEEEEYGTTMVLKVHLPSKHEVPRQAPSSRHRARSLTRSRSPFWRRRKQTQEYASRVYSQKQHELDGITKQTCSDIFRKSDRGPTSLEVDYMSRQFSSEYSFVEVILGDNQNKPSQRGKKQSAHATANEQHERTRSAFSDIPVQVISRKRSTKSKERPVKTLSVQHEEDDEERAEDVANTSPPPITDTAAVVGKDGNMMSPMPIAAIEVKRRRSDFVSELSEPKVIHQETVTSVRKALIKAQRRLAGASRWGKKASPEILLTAFMEVAESLESKDDRQMLRREMERILAESQEADDVSSSETEDSTGDESYVPVGMCQFPGDGLAVADDDVSETSSFADWLNQTQKKRGKLKSTFDVFNLSNLWTDKLSAEWESFLEDSDDDESAIPFQPIESPPPIDRVNSTSRGFLPRRASEAALPSRPIFSQPGRGRDPTRSIENHAPKLRSAKPASIQTTDKTLITSFLSDPFANDDWIEHEAQRILRNKSLQRIRSEKEKREAEEMALQRRASGTLSDMQKGSRHQKIEQRVLNQFKTIDQRGLNAFQDKGSASRQRTRSMQRSVPGQSVLKPETKLAVGYQIYRPDILKFAAVRDGGISASSSQSQTNNFGQNDKATETPPMPKHQPQNQNTSLPYTQRLLARKKEQLSRQQRRSKSMDNPTRRRGHRLIHPRQIV